MTTILAIDTATEACSVALCRDGQYSERYEVIPRLHSQRLLPMLQDLLPDGDLRAQGIDAIAYGCGPGSFTGLRIAASAVQGLAFANNLPAIPVSTLACQAQTALRLGLVQTGDQVLSMLDARINEVYWSLFSVDDTTVRLMKGPVVCSPASIDVDPEVLQFRGIGSGFRYLADLPAAVSDRLQTVAADLLPSARDMIPLALEMYARGETQGAAEVLPVYVREEISWKKLAEQGKRG
jgi:tRNA threonylcarbamoyladenosine biosynthesis protein TsaB